MDAPSDIELLTQISAGDVMAFEALYGRYARLAFSRCLRLLGDRTEAEEVTQDVFLRIWSQATRFNETRGTPIRWLLTIAHRLVIDHVRRRRSNAIPSTPEVEMTIATAFDDAGDRAVAGAVAAQVRRAIRFLAPEQRRALWLTYFAGYSQREVADVLAIPLGTVKSRIRLGLKSLRRLMGAESKGASGGRLTK